MSHRTWLATAAGIVLLAAQPASTQTTGGLWIGYVTRSNSGQVIVNLFTERGLPWDQQFRPVHEVEALDLVRQTLVRRQRIRDLPVLIAGPGSGEPRNRLSIDPECSISHGETLRPETGHALGECYRIELAAHHSISDQLALMLTLPELSAAVRQIDVEDLRALRAKHAHSLAPYTGMTLHFDPVWSPDGSRLLYTAWRSGTIRFELLDPASGRVTPLERLDGYMATRPVWSDDSRFVAFASRTMVKVYDARQRTTRTFRPQGPTQGMETLIQFEGTRLRLAFDRGFYSDYEVYVYDTGRRLLQRLSADAALPDEDAGHDVNLHASVLPVPSPNGRWIALFTAVNGQRRIAVRPDR